MEQGNERARAHQLTASHQAGDVGERYPRDVAGFFEVRGLTDLLGALADEDLVR